MKCEICNKTGNVVSTVDFVILFGKKYCQKCAIKYMEDVSEHIVLTTTMNIDKHFVEKYIDIESVEIVIGTGMISEMTTEFADFFGNRSNAFEDKLRRAKEIAMKQLKFQAYKKRGNAVIGVDLDYTEFSSNRIGLIVSGTIVEVERCRE